MACTFASRACRGERPAAALDISICPTRKATTMKTLVLVVLVAGLTYLSAGCAATPAYSGRERGRLIARNWANEGKQISDDIDHLLLLRGGANLTIWHIKGSP